MNKTSVETLFDSLLQEKDSIKKAQLIAILHNDKEISLKAIATKLNKHPSYISHYLRILQLPTIVLDGYYAKQISSAHLFILSRLKKEEDILKAYEQILSKSLTTVQTEELIRNIKFTVQTSDTQLSKQVIDTIFQEIRKEFPEATIKIIQTRIKGKIMLELKGSTEVTSTFIQKIADKLTKKAYPGVYDDTNQVIE